MCQLQDWFAFRSTGDEYECALPLYNTYLAAELWVSRPVIGQLSWILLSHWLLLVPNTSQCFMFHSGHTLLGMDDTDWHTWHDCRHHKLGCLCHLIMCREISADIYAVSAQFKRQFQINQDSYIYIYIFIYKLYHFISMFHKQKE